MPELPEVEVTARQISPHLLGRTITRVVTTKPSYFFLTPPSELKRRLLGSRIHGLERVGKYLLVDLGERGRLLLHLGMTGQLFTQSAKSPRLLRATAAAALAPEHTQGFEPDLHTHLQLYFADAGEAVFFRDVRKFGKVRWLRPGQGDARLTKLGLDALLATGKHLFEAARRRKAPIKSLLLDQSCLAGVGNIYADEALFAAGVRPTRRSSRVSRAECERIAQALVRILLRSIETGGSSVSDYVAPDGSDGGYQDERTVYARTGEPCLVCGRPIRRTLVGQRGTHYCAHCQT